MSKSGNTYSQLGKFRLNQGIRFVAGPFKGHFGFVRDKKIPHNSMFLKYQVDIFSKRATIATVGNPLRKNVNVWFPEACLELMAKHFNPQFQTNKDKDATKSRT